MPRGAEGWRCEEGREKGEERRGRKRREVEILLVYDSIEKLVYFTLVFVFLVLDSLLLAIFSNFHPMLFSSDSNMLFVDEEGLLKRII